MLSSSFFRSFSGTCLNASSVGTKTVNGPSFSRTPLNPAFSTQEANVEQSFMSPSVLAMLLRCSIVAQESTPRARTRTTAITVHFPSRPQLHLSVVIFFPFFFPMRVFLERRFQEAFFPSFSLRHGLRKNRFPSANARFFGRYYRREKNRKFSHAAVAEFFLWDYTAREPPSRKVEADEF